MTVGGQSAQMLSRTNFVANVNLTTGTNNIAVVAKDAINNTRTNTYRVVAPSGASKTLTYDGNGNLLSDGTNSYNWDAKHRMVKITYSGGASSEFTYDVFDRRVKIVERNSSSTVTSTKQFVWDRLQISVERDGSNAVKKRFFDDGWQDVAGSISYFYTKDHLGSVREVTNGSSTQVAQYNYDPYGRITRLSGSVDADFLYTGHYYHAASGLLLAPYRSYDPNLGRLTSRDPIGEKDGINLYAYVSNNPSNLYDSLGLFGAGFVGSASAGCGIGTGAGADASGGLGVFTDGANATPGGFMAGGAALGSPLSSPGDMSAIPSDQRQVYAGASVGAGVGFFLTNANEPRELDRPFHQWDLNLPLISLELVMAPGFLLRRQVRPSAHHLMPIQ